MDETTNDNASTETAVPQAVTDALAGIFAGPEAGNDSPDLSESTDAGSTVSKPFTVRRDQSREQADELEQEGLVDPNDPDGRTKVADPSIEATPEAEGIEKPVVPAVEKPAEGPKLDPFHRWAAQEAGFTDEQIDKLMTADAALAQQTFEAVAASYGNLSRQYLTPAAPVAPGTQVVSDQAAQTDGTPTPKLDKFMAGLAAFAEANGQEVADFAKVINDELATPLKALIAENRVREQNLLRQEAQTAFASVRKDFDGFYGAETGNVTADQQSARANLAALADQIRAGAKAQGKEVSVGEAIKRAHAVVTADIRSASARKAVVAQVEKRSKAVTAKPTQRRSPTQVAGRSDEAALEAYQTAALAAGLDVNDF